MPASPLLYDVGGSLDFGLDNNLRQTGVLSMSAVGSWGTLNIANSTAVIAFACRIPVDHIGTGSYDSHSTTLFETTVGGQYIKCVYYGARAPELAYRSRICFFGSDGSNGLGRIPPMSDLTLVPDGAARSAPLTDTQPRVVRLQIVNNGVGSSTVRVDMLQPGTTTIETGDVLSTTFLMANLGTLYVGAPQTPTTTVGSYFCGELSRLLCMNSATYTAGPQLATPLQELTVLSTDDNWAFASAVTPLIYWRLDGTPANSLDYFGGTNVRRGRRHIAFTPYAQAAMLLNATDPGKVMASPGGTVQFQVRYRAQTSLVGSGYFLYFILVNEAGATQAISPQVNMSFDYNNFQTTTVTFTNVPAGWYSLHGQYRTSTLQEYRWQATSTFGVGQRVWVLGDATLQKLVDNVDVSMSTPTVDGQSVVENATITVAESYTPGYFRKPRTVTRADSNQARLAWLRSAFPQFIQFGTMPTEYVVLATTGDSLAGWFNNLQTQSGTYLLTEYVQAFSTYSSFCTAWVVANDTADLNVPASQLEIPSYYTLTLDGLFGNPTYPSLKALTNNTVAPVHVIPRHRHQSTFLTLPATGELTETQVLAMRAGRRAWIAVVGVPPNRFEIGPWWSYGASYNPSYLTTVPTTTADWQDAASSFADALLGKHAGGGLVAKFGSPARNTIIIEDLSGTFGTLLNSNTTNIAISDNAGGFYTSLGYTTIISGSTITLSKTTGDWASVANGSMRVRYGYGFPLFQPTYPTSASASTLQNYYQSKQGVLFENSAQSPFRAFDLLVDPPVGGSISGPRLLAILGAGK
jgi:hypothetical protein